MMVVVVVVVVCLLHDSIQSVQRSVVTASS